MKKRILKTRGVLPSTVEAVLNVQTVVGGSGLMVDAAELAVEEAGLRCEIQSEQAAEIEVACWAWKALREERMFCFNSRMRCLHLAIPAGHAGTSDNVRASVLDHRQRAMASVVLHALTEPTIHRRHQLEEVHKGAGSLHIPPLDDEGHTNFSATTFDVQLRW